MAKDYTKYIFFERQYNKSRLLLAIVQKYLSENPKTTSKQLDRIFHCKKDLISSWGVFRTPEFVQRYKDPSKRYFLKKEELLRAGDGKVICVTRQVGDYLAIGMQRHRNFVEYICGELGYELVRVP